MEQRRARLQRHRFSNAIVRVALIATAVILLSAMLQAQEGSPEVTPPIPGTSWGSQPVQREWEPTTQEDAAQGNSQASTQDEQNHANAQVLMAQQMMAEQSKRMADFMFWQLILGVALLIGLCVTIYYARQLVCAAVSVSPRVPATVDLNQRAEGTRINQHRKVQP